MRRDVDWRVAYGWTCCYDLSCAQGGRAEERGAGAGQRSRAHSRRRAGRRAGLPTPACVRVQHALVGVWRSCSHSSPLQNDIRINCRPVACDLQNLCFAFCVDLKLKTVRAFRRSVQQWTSARCIGRQYTTMNVVNLPVNCLAAKSCELIKSPRL